MNLSTKQIVGIIVLATSGISAIAAPFLLHSPTTPVNNGAGQDNSNNNDNGNTSSNGSNGSGPGTGTTRTSSGNGHGKGPNQQLKDLSNKVGSCQTTNQGTQKSLVAKVNSAERATNSKQADHHLMVLQHQLETPAADKHASACLAELKGLVQDLLSS